MKNNIPICWDAPKEPVWCEDSRTSSKVQCPGGFLRKGVFFGRFLVVTTWFFRPPFLYFFFILTNYSCINDPPMMGYSNLKSAKSGYFDKTEFLGLIYPPKWGLNIKHVVYMQDTIPVILSHKNATGSAKGVRKGKNMAPKCPKCQNVKNGDSCKNVYA